LREAKKYSILTAPRGTNQIIDMITTSEQYIYIASLKNCPSSTQFEIVNETEKALQLKNTDIDSKHAYAVWVPKSMIAKDTMSLPACGEFPAVTVERYYFKGSIHKIMDKPWKRVAIGLSCY
jgi:hypothetical protein